MAKILLIAGDLTQSDRMAAFLAQHDFDPAQVSRGDLAVQAFRRHCAEIVVLDASPPGRDGLKVCRDLRALSAVPILMLSDIRNGQAQVQALDAGADDVVRPVSPHVLLARIRALLRRRNRSPLAPHRLAFGELVIDCEQRLAWQRGAEVADHDGIRGALGAGERSGQGAVPASADAAAARHQQFRPAQQHRRLGEPAAKRTGMPHPASRRSGARAICSCRRSKAAEPGTSGRLVRRPSGIGTGASATAARSGAASTVPARPGPAGGAAAAD